MKKKKLFLAALALVLVLSAGIGSASAYFTTYTSARGGATVHLGGERTFQEEFDSWTKKLTVTNKEGSYQAIFVRAKAYAPGTFFSGERSYPLTCAISGDGWTTEPDAEGWYYYTQAVAPGASTGTLNVVIQGIPKDAAELEDGDAFNVAVVYESIPAVYDAETGDPVDPQAADWKAALDSGTLDRGSTEGGLEP